MTGARGGIVFRQMPDVPSGVGVPDVFEDADTSGDKLRRLPYAGAGIERFSGRSGRPTGSGQRLDALDSSLSFAGPEASEL